MIDPDSHVMYTNPQSCFQASNTSREATEEGRRLSEVIFYFKKHVFYVLRYYEVHEE